MKHWNTAVIGAGFIGRVHLEAIRRLGHIQIAALADPELEKAKQLGAEFSVGRVEADFRGILEDRSIDAVHVCTPNHLDFPVAKAALEAGKQVLCEKPLATSVDDAKGLVAAASQAGKRNCLCHNLHYYPAVQQMRAMHAAGELGEILVVQGTYSQDWLAEVTDWNWPVLSSAGGPSRCITDIGSHWFDMAEHVTGCRVSALCTDLHTFHKTRKRPKAAIETFAGKTLRPDDYDAVAVDIEDFGAPVSPILISVPPETVTLAASIAMAITTWLALRARGVTGAWILVFLAGASMAPVFPTTLAIVGGAFPRMSGTAIGFAITCGWAGLAVSSRLIGAIAAGDAKRLKKALLVIPAFSVVMIRLNLVIRSMLH